MRTAAVLLGFMIVCGLTDDTPTGLVNSIAKNGAEEEVAAEVVGSQGVWSVWLSEPETNSSSSGNHHSPSGGDAPLTWKGIVTACTCVALLVVLSLDWLPCAVAMVASTVVLRLSGIITTAEALDGMKNSSVLTVQLLVMLIAPVTELPATKMLTRWLLHSTDRPSREVQPASTLSDVSILQMNVRVCVLAYALSWFVGNLAVTAMLTSLIHQHCLAHGVPSSQLLMPMEIATLVGGTFSSIGVSTTLLVSGMMQSAGLGALPFFEVIKVSGAPAIVALVYLCVAPRWLLPKVSHGIVDHVKETSSTFMAELCVMSSSPCIGKRVREIVDDDADPLVPLLHNDRVSLVQVVTPDGTLHAPPPEGLTIGCGDVLCCTGDPAAFQRLARTLHLEWVPAAADATMTTTAASTENLSFSKSVVSAGASPLGRSLARISAARLRHSTLRHSRGPAAAAVRNSSTTIRLSLSIAAAASAALPGAASTEYSDDESDDGGVEASPSMAEVVVAPEAPCVGLSIASIRHKYRLAVIGFRRRNRNYSPSECAAANLSLDAGDTVLVLGPRARIQRLVPKNFLVATFLEQDDGADEETGDGGGRSDGAVKPRLVVVPSWLPFGRWVLADGARVLPSDGTELSRRAAAGASVTRTPLDSAQNFGPSTPRSGGLALADERMPLIAAHPLAPPPPPATTTLGHATGSSPRYVKVLAIPPWYRYASLLVFAATIAVSIGGFELVVCCQVGVLAMLLLRLRTVERAYQSLKFEVFVVMAFSFGIGNAMKTSGLSLTIASQLGRAGLSSWTLYVVVSLCAAVLSNIMSSKAAVQVLFPVVVDLARQQGDNPLASICVLAVSVVLAFITPYAHASALIISGPGGYVTRDFYRFGAPLNVLMCFMVASAAYASYH